jgi:hypothetical protein
VRYRAFADLFWDRWNPEHRGAGAVTDVGFLVALALTDGYPDRVRALELLAVTCDLGDDDTTAAGREHARRLRALLDDPDPAARIEVLHVHVACASPDLPVVALGLTRDPDPPVRAVAWLYAAPLPERLDDRPEVRLGWALARARDGDAAMVPVLDALLADHAAVADLLRAAERIDRADTPLDACRALVRRGNLLGRLGGVLDVEQPDEYLAGLTFMLLAAVFPEPLEPGDDIDPAQRTVLRAIGGSPRVWQADLALEHLDEFGLDWEPTVDTSVPGVTAYARTREGFAARYCDT